jgi:GNAT superfamily N-acetyltransferase
MLEWEPQLGRQAEYKRAKDLLNAGRHPTFIGRQMLSRCAEQGGLTFAVKDGRDIGVAMIGTRTSTLLVMCVHPEFRSLGVGGEFLSFLRPNFARVLESAVPWFTRQGYKAIGQMKQGRTLRTQVMVREELIGLGGRLRRVYGEGCDCTQKRRNRECPKGQETPVPGTVRDPSAERLSVA